MTEEQISYMVSRFLNWKLPETFNPDGGISFKADFNEHTAHPMKHEPVGTNLFDGQQATAMVRYMLEGVPAGGADRGKITDGGMSLLDLFAGQALVGLAGDGQALKQMSREGLDPAQVTARSAYQMAAAMLAERAKTSA